MASQRWSSDMCAYPSNCGVDDIGMLCRACSVRLLTIKGRYKYNLTELRGYSHRHDHTMVTSAIKSTSGKDSPVPGLDLNVVKIFALTTSNESYPSKENTRGKLLLFHGTHAFRVPSILREGFQFKGVIHGRKQGPGVYFTSAACLAADFCRSRFEGSMSYLIACEIDCDDLCVVRTEEEKSDAIAKAHPVTKYIGVYGGNEGYLLSDSKNRNYFYAGAFDNTQTELPTSRGVTEYVVRDLNRIKPRYLVQLVINSDFQYP